MLGLAEPGDLVVVGFSGHGVHLDTKGYLCPTEAEIDKPQETMLAIDDVYGRMNRCKASLKLMLVDACRDDPRLGGTRSTSKARSITEHFASALERPPEGLLVMTSCAENQISLEEKEFRHGVSVNFLFDGLRGKVATADGTISLEGVYVYTDLATEMYAARERNEFQTPALSGTFSGPSENRRVDRSLSPSEGRPQQPMPQPANGPGPAAPPVVEVRPGKMITNSIRMKLALIPAGDFLMGSPQREEGHSEKQHRVRITKPFYLGAYEVTLDEFLKFYHAANYRSRWKSQGSESGLGLKLKDGEYAIDAGTQYVPWSWGHADQTPQHPVVNVSWSVSAPHRHWRFRRRRAFSGCRFGRGRFVPFSIFYGGPDNDASV